MTEAPINYRKCPFCGKSLKGMSRKDIDEEHIIPDWMIELSERAHIRATFGIDYRSVRPRASRVSIQPLVLPSCAVCNSAFGKMKDLRPQ